MTAQPHIIIVGADPTLTEEFRAAAEALRSYRPVLRFTDDCRQAAEGARTWRPQLALVDIEGDLSALKNLARDVQISAPETAVVGVFRPGALVNEAHENALLIEAYRCGVRDFLRRPVSSSDLSDLLDRILATAARPVIQSGKIVSFISNKGGVGKSTLAVNVACGLASRHPDQVLLVDSSLQLGTCASLLDLQPATTLTDVARQHDRLDETLIRQLAVPHPSGLHVLAAPATAMEAIEITDEVLSRLLTLARRSYKYTVVDTFPIVDRTVVAALDVSDIAYVVLENVVPTLLGVPRMIDLLTRLGVTPARQRIVLSRYQHVAGNPRREEVARRLGRPADHVVPYDRAVVTAANFGEPFVLRAGRFNSARRAILGIVDEVDHFSNRPPAPQAKPSAAETNGHADAACQTPVSVPATESAEQ